MKRDGVLVAVLLIYLFSLLITSTVSSLLKQYFHIIDKTLIVKWKHCEMPKRCYLAAL